MNVSEFQQSLTEICSLAEKNNKTLTAIQIKEYFSKMELEQPQLLKILQYLKLKGITIEGTDIPQTENEEPEERKIPLTPEEEAYLKEYLAGLNNETESDKTIEELFQEMAKGDTLAQAELTRRYLPAAAEMAASMNCEEIYLADLIQEANVSLLMALEQPQPVKKDDIWITEEIRRGIQNAIEEQTQRKFQDDYLVAKVQNLEAAVKELTEDEEDESKFSVEELSIILDMDVDEIRDVLRLTGDDK